jgi:hypothetical protein
MELALYTALKTHILTELPEIKSVRLWNNQPNRESEENAYLFPIVFLQFSPDAFTELSQGVQQANITVTTHLGFESYKDEDTYILTLKQSLYAAVQRFRDGNFSKLLRIAERPNFDHNNIQIYETDYLTVGKDFTVDLRPSTQVTAVSAITATITDP